MDSSLMPAVIGLTGTTIGAILGFGGGLLNQLVLEKRKQKFEREKQEYERQKEIRRKKAEKLEELVQLLKEDHIYIQAIATKIEKIMKDEMSIDELYAAMRQDSSDKIDAIVSVYFPEFQKHADIISELIYRFFMMRIEGNDQKERETRDFILKAAIILRAR